MRHLIFRSKYGSYIFIFILSIFTLTSCLTTEFNPESETTIETGSVTSMPHITGGTSSVENITAKSPTFESSVNVKNLFKAYGDKISLSPISETFSEYKVAYHTRYSYSVNYENRLSGTLIADFYELNGNDIYYCVKMEGLSDAATELQMELYFDVKDQYTYRYYSYPKGRDNVSSVLNGPFDSGQVPLSQPYTTYAEGDGFSMVLSCVNAYEKKNNEVLRDAIDKSSVVQISDGLIKLNLFIEENYIVEHWGIFSKDLLVDFSDAETAAVVKLADFGRFRKWTMNGQYYITPVSYIPSGEDYFYKNVAHHVGEKFLRTDGKYFDIMSKVALYVAVQDQNQTGIWPTTAESQWLSGDYGIKENFYDTRFNTDVGLFLIRGYRKHKDPALLVSAEKYANFLVDYAITHNFRTENGGYLVWDYTDKDLSLLPNHVSLNHLVTEMNFIYEMYIETKKPVYLLLGDKIKLAVDDTYSDWPKENNDLWYAYMPDGSYDRLDYVNLTLKDLRYSQQLIRLIYGRDDDKFDFLIRSKESYLKANNLPLY